MNDFVEPAVQLIGWTTFENPLVDQYDSEDTTGQDLAEFAGRACYQSWSRPNPATATNAGYLKHILDVGHYSVLEHGTATFYLTGVSRSLTHELVRHRHFSYSQLSQRYVDSKDAGIVTPPEMIGDVEMESILRDAMDTAVTHYEALADLMAAKLMVAGVLGTEARKRARQAARAVMPNMTETRIVVTGNYRAWRHFVDLRASSAADTEIRIVATKVFDILSDTVPNVFQDYEWASLDDGTYVVEREGEAG